jgi:hypothetical protein
MDVAKRPVKRERISQLAGSWRIETFAVATGALGLIKSAVSGGNEVVIRLEIIFPDGDSDADSESSKRLISSKGINILAHPSGHGHGRHGRSFGRDDYEFVTSITAKNVRGTKTGLAFAR